MPDRQDLSGMKRKSSRARTARDADMSKLKVQRRWRREEQVEMPRHWQQAADVRVPCITSLAVEYP